MKKIKYLYLLIFLAAVVFTGCEKKNLETEGLSTVTTYAIITLDGDAITYVQKGATYTDAGATASGGEDVIVTNPVNTAASGFYTVNYIAYNTDGFAATNSRLVVVWEQDDVIAGLYDCVRDNRNRGGHVIVSATSNPLVYHFTDLLAGYYEWYAGYGPNYAGPADVTISSATATGTCSGTGDVVGWSDQVVMLDGTYNNGVIKYTAGGAYGFFSTVTMTRRNML